MPSLAFLDLSGETRGVLLGAAVATVVGAVDDFRGLSPPTKLAGQVAAAAIPPAFGVWIDHFTFPFLGVVDLPAWIGVPLSILFIVAVMNMVNFLDGIDGLAAGVCAIAGVTYAILALSLGKPDPAILSAIVAGACLGFLRHNFFPARIFMGDSGALCLGFILAAVSIQGLLRPRRRSSSSCRCSSSRSRSSTRPSSSRSGSSTGSRSTAPTGATCITAS